MSGRNQSEGPLSAYMINLLDKRSNESITDKGLKMVHFSDSIYRRKNYLIK